jgi:hypothetical protein
MRTLLEIIKDPYMHQCRKHGLHKDPEVYADEMINDMTNMQLIAEIDQALKERREANDNG